jgi:hypothetical protein
MAATTPGRTGESRIGLSAPPRRATGPVVTGSTKRFEDPIALTRLPQFEDQAA